MILEWGPDPTAKRMTGAIVSGNFSIYEVRPGEWRSCLYKSEFLRCIGKGLSLDAAKARCEEYARTGK